MVIIMEKLRRAFLASNASIELIERCSLPYIYYPVAKLSGSESCVDVFYILDGSVELMFNNSSLKELSSGEFILLNRRKNDYFILSGHSDSVILHAKILPSGLYQDLVMCQSYYEHLQFLRKERSDILPAAAEMMKLMFSLHNRRDKMNSFMEIPIALFFIQLYLTENFPSPFTSHDLGHPFSGLMIDIIKRPGYPWRVKDMAKEYNMNTNLFIKEFRRVSGFTPFIFLKKIRLNRGKKLLINTEMPVSIIASECGYNSHASFAFYVKKEFGMSPVKIRENARKKI